MNKVILMGRLTRDPAVRYSQGAEPLAIARYSLAVNKRFKRQGEPDADFIPCVAFGKQGEFAEKYFRKGQMVSVQQQRLLLKNSTLPKVKLLHRHSVRLLRRRQVLPQRQTTA